MPVAIICIKGRRVKGREGEGGKGRRGNRVGQRKEGNIFLYFVTKFTGHFSFTNTAVLEQPQRTGDNGTRGWSWRVWHRQPYGADLVDHAGGTQGMAAAPVRSHTVLDESYFQAPARSPWGVPEVPNWWGKCLQSLRTLITGRNWIREAKYGLLMSKWPI